MESETGAIRITKSSCLECKRRKLRCTREVDGCSNCIKGGIPSCVSHSDSRSRSSHNHVACVKNECLTILLTDRRQLYPASDLSARRRKRGPYKKRNLRFDNITGDVDSGTSHGSENLESTTNALVNADIPSTCTSTAHSSDALIQDAISTLSQAHVISRSIVNTKVDSIFSRQQPASCTATDWRYPEIKHVWILWQIFISRVDPLTKIINPQTCLAVLLPKAMNAQVTGSAEDALWFGIYFAAVAASTPAETQAIFMLNRLDLLNYFSGAIESIVCLPQCTAKLEKMQALLIYLVAIRRGFGFNNNTDPIFVRALSIARELKLDKSDHQQVSYVEHQLRRRAWWSLCSLESGSAEEGSMRQQSIVEEDIGLPVNLNDRDLTGNMDTMPLPRVGCTDMTFPLVFYSVVRLAYTIRHVKRSTGSDGTIQNACVLKRRQEAIYEQLVTEMDTSLLKDLSPSRPYDWLCIQYARALTLKIRLQITFPHGQPIIADMDEHSRYELLGISVELIRITHSLPTNSDLPDWHWYFRTYVQWNALAVVIAAVGLSKNKGLRKRAWDALEPVLTTWDGAYQTRRDMPSWRHVHDFIQRARIAYGMKYADVQGNDTNLDESGFISTDPVCQGQDGMSQTTEALHWQTGTMTDPSTPLLLQDATIPDWAAFDLPKDSDFADTDLSMIDFAAFDAVFEEWEADRS